MSAPDVAAEVQKNGNGRHHSSEDSSSELDSPVKPNQPLTTAALIGEEKNVAGGFRVDGEPEYKPRKVRRKRQMATLVSHGYQGIFAHLIRRKRQKWWRRRQYKNKEEAYFSFLWPRYAHALVQW